MERNETYDFMAKCAVVGNCGVGKTSLIHAYLQQPFEIQKESTIGVEFNVINVRLNTGSYENDVVTVRYHIWDLSGKERYRHLAVNQLQNVKVVFLVFDVTNQKSFEDIYLWYQYINSLSIENADKILFVVVANKSDLWTSSVIYPQQLRAYCEQMGGIPSFIVSSKTGAGIETLFQGVTSMLQQMYKIYPTIVLDPTGSATDSQLSDVPVAAVVDDDPREPRPRPRKKRLRTTATIKRRGRLWRHSTKYTTAADNCLMCHIL